MTAIKEFDIAYSGIDNETGKVFKKTLKVCRNLK